MIKVKRTWLFNIFLISILLMISFFNIYTENINKIIAIWVMILSVVFVYKCRKSMPLFLMALFIAYSNYSVCMGVYLFPELRPIYLYPQITDVKIYGIGIKVLFLFMATIVLFFPKLGKQKDCKEVAFAIKFVRKENSNWIIFLGSVVLFIIIMILGYSRVDDGRGAPSAIYEYNVIVLILMFYYSGDKTIKKILCCILAAIYVLTSLLNGTRIEALSCMIVVFLCFFKINIPKKIILFGMFGGILVFNCIGVIRGRSIVSLELILNILQGLWSDKLVFDTCTYAFFPALCMIELFEKYSLSDAGYFFGRFLETILLGVARVEDGNLIKYTLDFYFHNEGGMTIGFFYVWFSYFGSIILGSIITIYIKFIESIKQRKLDLGYCIGLYFVATVPRWYLYGPWTLFRGVLICAVLYIFVNFVRKTLLTKMV